MTPGLWGCFTALFWGGSDFVARSTGQALGYRSATFGMLLSGSALLSLWVWLDGDALRWPLGGLWLLVASGLAILVATLLLYNGLARGPVSIVSPIVGSYPAAVVAFAVAAGARPDALHWAAMALTMLGVAVVARCADDFEGGGRSRADLRRTVGIALGSALAFAIGVFTAQLAVPIYGNLQTLWVSRLISLLALMALFLARRSAPSLTRRWAPFVLLQGLLDSSGYLALYQGSYGAGAEIAAVTASAFGAVTTILARIFLREPMRALQWAGILIIFIGVAVLST